jgi:hypothetical protein
MATEQKGQEITLTAGQSLASYQNRFVTVAGDGKLDPAGDGADADGVLQDNPAADGRAAAVCIGGVVKVECGNSTTLGGYVASDSVGRAVDAVSGDYKLGKFLEAGTKAGDVVSILFFRGGATV